MSGFLSELGLGAVQSDPNAIADGIYPGFIVKSEIVTKRDESRAWKITYRVIDEFANSPGAEQDEWWNNLGTMSEKAKGFLKRRVLMLGIPEDKIDSINPETLIGTSVWFKVYTNKNGYQAIGDLKLRKPNHVNAEDYIKDPPFSEAVGGYLSNPVPGDTSAFQSNVASPAAVLNQVSPTAQGVPDGL